MSMFRSPSRLKFSPHRSREFMRALVAAKRVASGRPALIPSTMAVSTWGVGEREEKEGGWVEGKRKNERGEDNAKTSKVISTITCLV